MRLCVDFWWAIYFQSYTAVVFKVASLSFAYCARIGVCVCVTATTLYITGKAARIFSEPRCALSCNSLCRGPIIRMFLQLRAVLRVVMQLYCVA